MPTIPRLPMQKKSDIPELQRPQTAPAPASQSKLARSVRKTKGHAGALPVAPTAHPTASPATPDFVLLRHLPHLLRRAHFEADAVYVQMHGDTVTSRQLALLSAVDRRPGASQSQVAEEIGLDLNTCSDLVARTVAKGLLRRERSPNDARTFCLHLTDEGNDVARDGLLLAAAYQDALARRLEPGERKQLIALIRKMLGFD